MTQIPSTTNASKLDKYFKDLGYAGVNIKALPDESEAKRLAGEANRFPDSYLWSKDEFGSIGAALRGTGDDIVLRDDAGQLTREGKILEDLSKAKTTRADVFGVRNRGKVLVARLDGLDWGQLWGASGTAAGPSLGLQLFAADPTARATRPGDEGVFLAVSGVSGIDGEPRVEVKRRGNLSRFDGEKEQLAINVRGKYGKTIGDLKLLNCQREPSQGIRVELINEWLAALGLPNRLTAPLQLVINDEYRGSYLLLEDLDDVYYDRNFPLPKKHERLTVEGNQRGNGFEDKASLANTNNFGRSGGGVRVYDPTNGTSDDVYRHLGDFIDKVNGKGLSRTDEGRFNTDGYLASMEKVLDVWGFLRTAALIFATGSWDTMYRTDGNFELHFDVDETTGNYKASVLVTDWDSSLGTSWEGGHGKKCNNEDIYFGGSGGAITLTRNLLKNDKARAYYTDCLHYILNDLARPDKVHARVQELWNGATGASSYRDEPGQRNATYPFDRETVRRHVQEQMTVRGWGARGTPDFYSESPARFLEEQRNNVNRQIGERHVRIGQSGADFKNRQFLPNFSN